MRTIRISIMGAMAVALLMTLGYAEDARAGIRVRGTLHTPSLRVHVDTSPSHRHVKYRRASLPDRHRAVLKLSRQDRRIAKRLARYTGAPKRELLRMRRMGYRWSEIGRWLDVPRRVVRAARSSRAWDRFLRHDRLHAGRDHGRIWITQHGGCSCND